MGEIKINFDDYTKLVDIAIANGKPVADTLMDILMITNKYKVSSCKKRNKLQKTKLIISK